MSDSLQPHRPQFARLPCPSLSPWVCSNLCPSSHWCHPAISSSVVPLSSCLQSFPASGSFAMSQFFPNRPIESTQAHWKFQKGLLGVEVDKNILNSTWNNKGPGSANVTLRNMNKFGESLQFSCSVMSDCDPMHCSMPGLPVHHQLLEFTQTHVHRVSDAIQPSHPLSSPSPPALILSQHQGLFKQVSSSHQVAKILEFQLQHQSFQWTPRTDLL